MAPSRKWSGRGIGGHLRPAHPERWSRCRGIAPAECLEQTGVEFSEGSNEGGAQSMSRRFGRTTSAKKRKEKAYGKGVGLGISVLLALIVISLAVWLLRRSTRDESTSATPEPEEGVEAGPEEERVVAPDTPSAEDVPPREEPPPGEERPERRGDTLTSPPTPREEPPPGEERPGRR